MARGVPWRGARDSIDSNLAEEWNGPVMRDGSAPPPESPEAPSRETQILPGPLRVPPVGAEGSPGTPDSAPPPLLPAPSEPTFAPQRWCGSLCCWVALGTSLTSLVLAGLLLRETRRSAGPPGPPSIAVPRVVDALPSATIHPALQPYLERAQVGDTSAMRMLGLMHYHGLNLPPNRAEGLKWIRRAAEAGSPAAREELKHME